MNKKIVSVVELTLIVMSAVAFAYFLSTDLPEVFIKENSVIKYLSSPSFSFVSANLLIPTGCCKESKSGAICTDMLLVDKDLCKTDLISTNCQLVSECQRGCCYDSDSGICSLNAPKEKCTSRGGEWDSSESCNIPQCQLGCCMIGTNAIMSTSRECTAMSEDSRVEKIFRSLDNKGSCDAYTNSGDIGACIFQSDDFSKENKCTFTTKQKCVSTGGTFRKDYLCTSKELNTSCKKTTKTSCTEEDDRIYFIDSCGNKANIYDTERVNDDSYWEKIISPENSCVGSPETCGNCEYRSGSICTKYFDGRGMVTPRLGEYVCRNLDCANGKKHGESWCVSDSNDMGSPGQAVGTRSYVASCFEGEIILEGCADFNQEICIEHKSEERGYTEATCLMNDWRSCVYANDQDSYVGIKMACDKLPQCVMFNEIPGNEKYKELPGFKENITNDKQGRAGDVGKDINAYVIQCVPRFTPGYQFWNVASEKPFEKDTKLESFTNYGGSVSETNKLCGLATFKCVSHIETTMPLVNPTPHDKENPECNMQAVSQTNQKVSLMMEALNEKCRMMGSCGMQYNIQGELGSEGFSVSRVYVDKKGKTHGGYTTKGYNFTADYINLLKNKQKTTFFGEIKKLSELENVGAFFLDTYSEELTSISGENPSLKNVSSKAAKEAKSVISGDNMKGGDIERDLQGVNALTTIGVSATSSSLVFTSTATWTSTTSGSTYFVSQSSSFGGIGAARSAVSSVAPEGASTSTSLTGFQFDPTALVRGLGVAAVSIVGSIIGSYIGGMIAKSSGMTPGESTALIGMMGAAGSALAVGLVWVFTSLCNNPVGCIVAIVIAVIMIIYSTFTGVDHEYYITEFTCGAWQPPKTGICEECNEDVRPCSEFKCRSLGANCRYFIENGEPGYCASLQQIWSAKITPWEDVLSSGNKYTNISSAGMRIVNAKNSKEVEAWRPIKFGISTDEPAICKLDTNHSKKYEEMKFVMGSDKNYETGKFDGQHHWIVLSPHTIIGENELDTGTNTPPFVEGENEYYILCKNFAGSINGAPFVVSVKQAEGPDKTPANIVRTTPSDSSFLALDTTNITFWTYLDEPAECKYSIEYDYDSFEEMPNNMSCITAKDQGFNGEWPCMTEIPITGIKTKLFVKCKDQPSLEETELRQRNQNSRSYLYEFNSCYSGLTIEKLSPGETVDIGENREFSLDIKTTGCIREGEAHCAFRLPYYGETYSSFLSTGGTTHRQPLVDLGVGERTIEVYCVDEAGNDAQIEFNVTINHDTDYPKIIRTYVENDRLIIETDEDSNCAINTDDKKECEFDIIPSDKYVKKHSISLTEKNKKQTLYIRCEDKNHNSYGDCTGIVKYMDVEKK